MDGSEKFPVLVVFGPTAVGKTRVAEKLFTGNGPFSGLVEIISADSMQVYRGMDIGTAKPDHHFLSVLPHHGINLRNPNQQFSAGDFVFEADASCRDIVSRGKLPVLLGGTGFYIKNFLLGMPQTPPSNPEKREALKKRIQVEGSQRLMDYLRSVDPVSAGRIHQNDEYRIVRALEVYETSGKPVSSFSLSCSFRTGYRFLTVVLERTREELYARISERVDQMFELGLTDEFLSLYRAGYTAEDPGMQAIGYREFFCFDPLGSSLERVRNMISHSTKRYAKRQETYVRAIPTIHRVRADDISSLEQLYEEFLNTKE